MNDLVGMAVVDAGENLLHEHRSILLSELASGHNLVEELTALADVRDNVVTLLIFEELVHLQNVGMIEILEIVDLIEKHLLFIIIHVRFSEDLDGSLGPRFTMNANSDFSKGSGTEHFTDPIVIS